jgi:acetyltransferase-like isoleucine patch superfamily enzyme
MDGKHILKLGRAYAFLARNIIGGKVVNLLLDLLAFMDYRMLILLSMWHPDHDTRIKYLRKRGVQVGEHVFVDQGAWIEITTPQSVVLEDYSAVAYGAVIVAHDATVPRVVDVPLRVKETRLKYGSGVGMGCIVMPGVTFEEYGHAMAGAVVTKDVPAGMVVAGNPAEVKCSCEDIGLAWQADIPVHPENYYDHPSAWRPPSTPYDHLITWRKEGIKARPVTDLRTGTILDYIIESKAKKQQEGE